VVAVQGRDRAAAADGNRLAVEGVVGLRCAATDLPEPVQMQQRISYA
jgi:hypothetical protein